MNWYGKKIIDNAITDSKNIAFKTKREEKRKMIQTIKLHK
jgi:hypothetical protein